MDTAANHENKESIVIPVRTFKGANFIGLTHQSQDGEASLELPHGSEGNHAPELMEKAGHPVSRTEFIGTFRTDLRKEVGVWYARTTTAAERPEYVKAGAGEGISWYTPGEIQAFIFKGRISDSRTLAALSLLNATTLLKTI